MNLLKTLKRGWKIYVAPPKETRIFFRPSTNQLGYTKIVGKAKTALQPKQVSANLECKLAYVTGMSSQLLQEFSYAEDNLVLTRQWNCPEQCVEVEYLDGFCYLTTTNFRRGSGQSSHLRILDTSAGEFLSSINTGGEWSKVIKLDTSHRVAYVSNWHSNSLSIIDVHDRKNPRVIEVLACSEAPRGIAVRPDGVVIATSFYGRRIFQIASINGRYQIVKQSPVFEPTTYGGNMRDVLLTRDGRTAWVSNLGRNLLHWYDAETLELCGSISVSRKPNSIRFLDNTESLIAVSCRKDNLICFIDTTQKCVAGVSMRTGADPTGLAAIDNGLLVTTFADNTLELHRLNP
jgi:YVTN family beta-propeller protein